MLKNFLMSLTRNPISLFGAAVTTASAMITLTLFLIEMFGGHGSPYVGIIAFMIMPAFFMLGLLLIPVGILRERRRQRRAAERGEAAPRFPVIDLNLDRTRNWVMMAVVFTALNLIILAVATFKGVETMETTEFCGTACHSVMAPEYTAYQRSAHARVSCVQCHIGPGAGWFVKSKLSGSWQLVSVNLNLYPRPIPTPVHALRPARDTCEQCHWPTKFVGDRLQVNTHYADDEENTELKSVLLLRIGGLQGRESSGIHWHVDPNIQVRYRSDPSREKIYDVELTEADGTVKLYASDEPSEATDDEHGEPEWRVMDCIDCHNRPSHTYRLPEQEVDLALLEGDIDRSLPYVRREAIRAMRGEYATTVEARAGIRAALQAFYEENYPDVAAGQGDVILEAAETAGDLYSYNVFPQMNVDWGTYPSHIGHTFTEGCFRCHDDLHETADGETISQDCDTCHTLLAMEEEDPAVLDELQP